MMSNVKLPQKAGFAPTAQEWDQLVRIAENLAAQVVQAQAERDAAKSAADFWGRSCNKIMVDRDAYVKRDRQWAIAARKAAQWARKAAYDAHISELCFGHARDDAERAEQERDAARAEVARLTERLETAMIALRGRRLAEQARVLNELADNVAELDQQECAALRQPAPETAKE